MFKKFFKKVKNNVRIAKTAIMCCKAEGYVDSGVKILIAVVIGALLLTLLYALFGDVIMPAVSSRITSLFSYAG